MKGTQALLHGALALGALGLAYLAWQHPRSTLPPAIRVLDLGQGALQAARFTDEGARTFVEVTRDPAADGSLVTISKRTLPGKGELPERRVRGDANATRLLGTLASLTATRKLGILPDEKLRALGLSPVTRTLSLSPVAGPPRTFQVAPPPAGASDPYLRDPVDGTVYVVGRTILADFENAPTRLVDRHPHAFSLAAVERLRFTAGPKQRTAVVKPNPGGAPTLAYAETPDTADTDLKKLHDRLFSVWPLEVLGQGELPPGGAPDVVLRIDYFLKDGGTGFFELARGRQPVSTDKEPPLYARSENLLGYLVLAPELASVLPALTQIVR